MSHFGDLSSDRDRRNEVKVQVIYAFSDVSVDFTVSEEEVDVRVGLMQDIHSFVDQAHRRDKFITAKLVHINQVSGRHNQQMIRSVGSTRQKYLKMLVFVDDNFLFRRAERAGLRLKILIDAVLVGLHYDLEGLKFVAE